MAEDVGQAYVGIVPSLKGFSARLKAELAGELGKLGDTVGGAGDKAGRSFGQKLHDGIKSKLGEIGTMLKTGLVVGAAAAAAGLATLTGFGLKSAAALEQTKIGIEALTGSAQEAQKFIAELQQFAAKTPFEFAGVADASRRILAFGQSVGITRDEVVPTLTTIGDLVSVLGGTQENVDSVVRALGQMASKGKVSQEELLQLAEALPGFNANAAIASAMGLSVADSMDLITKGGVDATTGINALLAGMAKFPGAAGAMQKQSETLLGVWSTFKDTMSIALTNAFQPAIPAIKGTLAQLTPVIGSALDTLGPAIGSTLTAALPLIGQLVTALTPILTPLLDLISGITSSLAESGALESLGTALGALLQPLVPLGPVIGDLAGKLVNAFVPVLNKLAESGVIDKLVNALIELMPSVVALIPPLVDLSIAMLPLTTLFVDLLVALLPILDPILRLVALLIEFLAQKAIVPLVENFAKAVEMVLGPIAEFSNWLKGLDWAAIGKAIGGAFTDGWNAITKFFGDAKTWLTGLPGKVVEWVGDLSQTLVDKGKDLIRGLWSGISSMGGWIWDKVKGFANDWIVNPFKNMFGIHSPSTLFAGFGEDTVAGYVQGIEASARNAAAAQSALVPAVSADQRMTPAAAPQRVAVGSSDALIAAAINSIRDAIRSTYGGDVDLALGA